MLHATPRDQRRPTWVDAPAWAGRSTYGGWRPVEDVSATGLLRQALDVARSCRPPSHWGIRALRRVRRRSDRRVGVAEETLVFADNVFRCPLMGLVERYGTEHGPVTDICLPKRFAHNMPAIHAPLLVAVAYLPARTLMHPGGAPLHVDPQTDRHL